MKTEYRYRITSTKAGSSIQLQTFVSSWNEALKAIDDHKAELPGCKTEVVDLQTGNVINHAMERMINALYPPSKREVDSGYESDDEHWQPTGGIIPGID